MSLRTIIEINHDHIFRLEKDSDAMTAIIVAIVSGDDDAWEYLERIGVRKITTRHHSNEGVIQFANHAVKLP